MLSKLHTALNRSASTTRLAICGRVCDQHTSCVFREPSIDRVTTDPYSALLFPENLADPGESGHFFSRSLFFGLVGANPKPQVESSGFVPLDGEAEHEAVLWLFLELDAVFAQKWWPVCSQQQEESALDA